MKIAVIGGREYRDFAQIERVLHSFIKPSDVIISGGARGVDSFAEQWAKEHKIKCAVFEPNEHSRQAYLRRNDLIAWSCEVLLAFPDEFSRGTYYTIKKAQKLGKRVIVFDIPLVQRKTLYTGEKYGK